MTTDKEPVVGTVEWLIRELSKLPEDSYVYLSVNRRRLDDPISTVEMVWDNSFEQPATHGDFVVLE